MLFDPCGNDTGVFALLYFGNSCMPLRVVCVSFVVGDRI